MMIRVFRFNTYLVLLAAMLVAVAASGCKSTKATKSETEDTEGEDEETKIAKGVQSSLRLFLEVNPDGSDRTETVMIGRERPFPVHVNKEPFLTEGNIEHAEIVEAFGGFSIAVQFDKQGQWLLDLYTTSYKGRRIAIAAEFGELRWIAAPMTMKGLTEGRIVFVPDATRKESERIVQGLNHLAKFNGKSGE